MSDLRDPELLPGLESAARRVHEATRAGKKITIFGDYDADGMTSTAILLRGLRVLNADVDFYVPSRIDEGYGLNTTALEALAERGTNLVITVDCGIASLEEAADVIAEYTGRPRRRDLSGLSKNLRLDPDGRYRWHWDPSFVKQRDSRDKLTNPERLTEAVKTIDLPLLLVRGQMSNLVTPEIAEDFLRTVPHAEYVDVKDARHMVAGDKNDIFSRAILDFLGKQNCRATAQPA